MKGFRIPETTKTSIMENFSGRERLPAESSKVKAENSVVEAMADVEATPDVEMSAAMADVEATPDVEMSLEELAQGQKRLYSDSVTSSQIRSALVMQRPSSR